MLKQPVIFEDLGGMEYGAAWDLQDALMRQNLAVKATAYQNADAVTAANIATTNYLLLVEHPPVLTLGKSGSMSNVLLSMEELRQRGVSFFHTNRGGDITFHGPGQIVGYPLLDLEKFYTDIGKYLRSLEDVIIRTLAHFGIAAGRSPGETGVWIDADVKGRERKICAMGVRCSRWLTMHGFALNVNTDLDYFNMIVPCGIADKQVTSMQAELGLELEMNDVKSVLKENFENVFGVKLSEPEKSVQLQDTANNSS